MIDPRRSARLALLTLRSSVPPSIEFRLDVIRLGHRGRVLEIDAAVEALAALPKPVGCWTSVEDQVLVINLLDRHPIEPSGGFGPLEEWYAEQYGAHFRESSVLCLGRFEWMIVTFGELESWEDEYRQLSGGWQGNAFSKATDLPDDAQEAALRFGVVHVNDHRLPDRRRGGIDGRIAIARRDPPANAGTCVRCGERPARFVVEWFLEEHPRRPLCQRCIDEELQPQEFDMGRMLDRRASELAVAERTMSREELARMAEEEAMFWALRPMPPFIRAFVERHW